MFYEKFTKIVNFKRKTALVSKRKTHKNWKKNQENCYNINKISKNMKKMLQIHHKPIEIQVEVVVYYKSF